MNLLHKFEENYLIKHVTDLTSFYYKIQLQLPDLILLDINFNYVISAVDIHNQLKSNIISQSIPIILFSSDSDEVNQRNFNNINSVNILIEPISTLDLQLIFNQFIPVKKITTLQESTMSKLPLESNMLVLLNKLEKIILSNKFNGSKITEMANGLGMSKLVFDQFIQKTFSKTPNKYIRDLQLNEAEKLLNDQSKTVFEIAEIVGFKSTSYFISVFKKKYGQTPSSFRKGTPKFSLKDHEKSGTYKF